MPTVQVEAQLSLDALIRAVEQLDSSEFDQFVSDVLALRAARIAPSMPSAETELLLKINRGLSADRQKRFDDLVARRQAETLTPEERDELIGLSEEIEQLEAERAEHLALLARLRKVSMATLLDQLGIRAPAYA